MSQSATELCIVLVDEIYGELTSRIFGVLTCYGRLSQPAIIQRSGLNPRQVRHALAVLIQQHLAFWFTSLDDGLTYYEANLRSAYSLIRPGKLIRVVEDRFGDTASTLVSNLLLSGHVRVGDLEKGYNLSHEDDTTPIRNGTFPVNGRIPNGNGTSNCEVQMPSLETIHPALSSLIDAGFVTVVNESHFRSAADNKAEAESLVKQQQDFQGMLKKDAQANFEKAVKQVLEGWRLSPAGATSQKRSREDYNDGYDEVQNQRKKLKIGGAKVNGIGRRLTTSVAYLDTDLVLRINNGKFEVIARNERLVELAAQEIGKTAAMVYAELLRLFEDGMWSCERKVAQEDGLDDDHDSLDESRAVTTMEIIRTIKGYDGSSGGIGYAELSKIDLRASLNRKRKRWKSLTEEEAEVEGNASPDENEEEEEEAQDEEPDMVEDEAPANGVSAHRQEIKVEKEGNNSTLEVTEERSHEEITRQNLFLLAEHPYEFITHLPHRGMAEERWTVNFPSLCRRMRLVDIERTIASRYGPEALRITRILHEKGKLDEKAIANFSLMSHKTMRSILTSMHEGGHLELQEIPRDTGRQASRTMFLWFFDAERCRQKILQETHKTMARFLQRIRVEREAIQGVLEKAARTDVVGKEDEYLDNAERETLRQWREKEEWLLGEVGRLDDLVAVLRDF